MEVRSGLSGRRCISLRRRDRDATGKDCGLDEPHPRSRLHAGRQGPARCVAKRTGGPGGEFKNDSGLKLVGETPSGAWHDKVSLVRSSVTRSLVQRQGRTTEVGKTFPSSWRIARRPSGCSYQPSLAVVAPSPSNVTDRSSVRDEPIFPLPRRACRSLRRAPSAQVGRRSGGG